MQESKYLRFSKHQRPGLKTLLVKVWANESENMLLGEIKWYGPWRQYAFFPSTNTLYEKTCLADITCVLKTMMEERKK